MTLLLIVIAALLVQEPTVPVEDRVPGADWLQWRGPGNSGSAEGCSPPLAWSAQQNIRWRSKVVGRGAATPIVVKDRVFLLTAVETDEKRTPAPRKPLRQDKPNDPPPADPPSHVYDFVVLCYARQDGNLLWQKIVNSELPQEGHHPDGSYASGSAASDGNRIYAYFNSFGLYALDMEGNVLWERDFGEMTFDRGEGASAALYDGTLVIPWDHRGPSEVIAVDGSTGNIKWRKDRPAGANRSTPVFGVVEGRTQVVLYGGTARGYDLETGEVLWTCKTGAVGSIASPIVADGIALLYASNEKSRFLGALDLKTAKGDCSTALLWQEKRDVPHISSPACHRGILYVLKGDSTLLSAFDVRTGARHYGPERLELGTVYSSLVAAGDRVYITDREGVTFVLRHGTKFEILQRNELGEEVASSMALAGDQIFLRGVDHLYCIADGGTAVAAGRGDAQQEPPSAHEDVVVVPKIWDERELASWPTPIAGVNALPNFYSEEEYYAAPVDNLRTYPVYDPDREPPAYMEWLKKQEPMRLIEPEKLRTKADWIEAGRVVFDGLDFASFRTDDPKVIAWFHDRAAIAKDPPVVTKDGIYPLFRWVIDADRKLKLTAANCASCHGHVLEDGSLLRGAPANVFAGGQLPFDACIATGDRVSEQTFGKEIPGEIYYREFGVPWLEDDVHARYRGVETDAEFGEANDFAPDGTFARFNGSPFFITRFADLIGVKDHRYLDATGTHANRGPEDIARYGILVQFADDGSVGSYQLVDESRRRVALRPPDEAMYALALFLYSLDYPKSPHPFDALAVRGQQVFESEKCGNCHTPPLYTDNKLIAVDGFEPPEDDPHSSRLHVSKKSVGTDPGLALKTRKGTGYYKVPALRGLWYRGLLEHSGSIATLEDWFDADRLRQDYVPTGWKGPGVKTRAVPGHEFGLDLSADDKRALIAFLRTL